MRPPAHSGEHGGVGARDNEFAKCFDVFQTVFGHHRIEPASAHFVAGHQRVEVAFHLHRLAHIGANDFEHGLAELPRIHQFENGHEQTFVIHLRAIGPEAQSANIDHVHRRGKQSHHAFARKHRCDHGEIVEVAGAFPGVVGHIRIAGAHAVCGIFRQKMPHRFSHRIHMAGRAGYGLCNHAAIR